MGPACAGLCSLGTPGSLMGGAVPQAGRGRDTDWKVPGVPRNRWVRPEVCVAPTPAACNNSFQRKGVWEAGPYCEGLAGECWRVALLAARPRGSCVWLHQLPSPRLHFSERPRGILGQPVAQDTSPIPQSSQTPRAPGRGVPQPRAAAGGGPEIGQCGPGTASLGWF